MLICYKKYNPSADVANIVKSFEFLEYLTPATHTIIEHVVPSGNPYLLICFKGSTKSNTPPFDAKPFPENHVSGQFVRHVSSMHHGFGIFTVYFHPEIFHQIFRLPMHELTQEAVSLSTAFGIRGNIIVEKIKYAQDYRAMVTNMEAFIRCSIIKNIIPVHDHVEYAIKDINQHPTHTIEDVCRQLKVTSRHLRRQFKEKIGIGPKYYLRIKRVNKAIALTRNNPRINLQDIVFQCNFFDQSHMAKEFNLFTGKTPYDYIVKNNRNLEMGIIS